MQAFSLLASAIDGDRTKRKYHNVFFRIELMAKILPATLSCINWRFIAFAANLFRISMPMASFSSSSMKGTPSLWDSSGRKQPEDINLLQHGFQRIFVELREHPDVISKAGYASFFS